LSRVAIRLVGQYNVILWETLSEKKGW